MYRLFEPQRWLYLIIKGVRKDPFIFCSKILTKCLLHALARLWGQHSKNRVTDAVLIKLIIQWGGSPLDKELYDQLINHNYVKCVKELHSVHEHNQPRDLTLAVQEGFLQEVAFCLGFEMQRELAGEWRVRSTPSRGREPCLDTSSCNVTQGVEEL